VIWSAADFTGGTGRPSGSGIPILFPFPGRVTGTPVAWEGRQYTLKEGDGCGNAIHGFVHERPWRVVEQSADRVTGRFQASIDDPQLLDAWPADFRITATYEIAGGTLAGTFLIENPDAEKTLPCGLGMHSYFRIPLGGGSAGDCILTVPVSRRWELVDMLATGQELPLANREAFRAGLPLGDTVLDDVFTGLDFVGDMCTAGIEDPAANRRVSVAFDRAFRECVVYTPPHREAICIEPYTCVPDAIRLADAGIDSGLRVLAPGESFEARVQIDVQRIQR